MEAVHDLTGALEDVSGGGVVGPHEGFDAIQDTFFLYVWEPAGNRVEVANAGARLILRRGAALDVLQRLMIETGATGVWWSRLYDPASVARDTDVKASLKAAGHEARSFEGRLLFEPWTVTTKTGGFYKVFTPMWKSVRDHDLPPLLPTQFLRP